MARRPRTRDVDASTAQPGGSARREWLATWKAIAVARLPESASAAIRADLRRSVEQTLARLGPEHDNDEVADAVGAVVGILIERLDAEAKEKARMQRQRERRRARREALVGGSVVTLGYVTKTLVERPELRRATLLAAKAARDKARLLFSKMFRSSQPPTP